MGIGSGKLVTIMANVVFRCHSCGAAIPLAQGEKIVRRDECPGCGADLKCCRNCRSFDPGRHNQCADSSAEWVADKESRNFCDFFEPRTTVRRRRQERPRSPQSF